MMYRSFLFGSHLANTQCNYIMFTAALKNRITYFLFLIYVCCFDLNQNMYKVEIQPAILD